MSPPSPIPPPPPVRVTGGFENGSTTAREEKSPSEMVSPLKAAADLIQTLDLAYAEMTACAADAAKDAEEARRNARTASEIARRYLNRSYPKGQSNFGTTPSPKLELIGGRPVDQQRGEYKEEILGPSLETPSSQSFHSLNGVMTNGSKPNTPTSAERKKHFFVSNSPSRSRTRTYNPTSSADRIAQSHAEDVLALSLELERARQSYQSEQRMHDETKTALSTQMVKANALQEENKKLKEQLELFQREREQIAELQQELTKARYLVQAAEEDAQLALDLAKDSSEKRDAIEEELQRTLAELRLLKEQPPSQLETPRRTVHFMDESPAAASVEVVPNSQNGGTTPSRSMVAAGRQILRRSFASSPGDEIITLELTPAKSAERRRRLRERLTQLDDSSPLALLPSTTQQPPKSPQRTIMESEDCRNAAKLIQESGRRLELAGHWWRKGLANLAPLNEMEGMTRQYCQSVEFKVERQHKEIKELESLCGFLERKLVAGSGESS